MKASTLTATFTETLNKAQQNIDLYNMLYGVTINV